MRGDALKAFRKYTNRFQSLLMEYDLAIAETQLKELDGGDADG